MGGGFEGGNRCKPVLGVYLLQLTLSNDNQNNGLGEGKRVVEKYPKRRSKKQKKKKPPNANQDLVTRMTN